MTRRRMLATDLDGTFIGADASDHSAMVALWDELERHGISVVFSTGRHLRSIEAFRAAAAPDRTPSACVCMVGTEIWHRSDEQYELDVTYERFIASDWDKAAITAALAPFEGLSLQPDEWQSPFKASYFVDDDAAEIVAREITERLADLGLGAKVVASHDRLLDLLPPRSGKGGAVTHLARNLGIDAANVATAGDSGNDLDMMRPELGFHSIAVSNAAPELRSYRHDRLYHAGRPYAHGIREGLVALGWLPA